MTNSDEDGRIAELGLRLAKAIEQQEVGEVRWLRAEIDRLAGVSPDARHGPSIGRGSPGAMGLGSDQPTVRLKRAWTPPAKPDPMTANTRTGGRRRKDG